jgi:hypothetical protein
VAITFMSHSHERTLIKLLLPEGMLDFFELTKVDLVDEVFKIYLQEINNAPPEYAKDKLTSKGFFEEVKIQDFPIRGKAAFLYIKRRRWLNETTGDTVFRNWELVAKGTRLTKDFAAFLKVIHRYQSSQL